jgi:serine/threonine protein kinase
MLDGRGNVRIGDLGLAIVAHGAATPADRAGTPAYMAPEQLDGRELSIHPAGAAANRLKMSPGALHG